MRKLLYWLEVFAIILTLVVISGFIYLTYKGFGVDKESKAYAESAIQAITSHLDGHELLSRQGHSVLT